jgi:PTH1 family peptidyl-tRNA hydrolase
MKQSDSVLVANRPVGKKNGLVRFLIAGLGNPGEDYRKNRHNAGVIVVNEILRSSFFTDIELSCNCIIESVVNFSSMNISGEKLNTLYKKGNYDFLIVLVDDLETELGKIKKVYPTIGHKGQNGIRDIMRFFKNDFCTIRIGIGRPGGNTTVNDFVLSDFSVSEMKYVVGTIEEVKLSLKTMIESIVIGKNG